LSSKLVVLLLLCCWRTNSAISPSIGEADWIFNGDRCSILKSFQGAFALRKRVHSYNPRKEKITNYDNNKTKTILLFSIPRLADRISNLTLFLYSISDSRWFSYANNDPTPLISDISAHKLHYCTSNLKYSYCFTSVCCPTNSTMLISTNGCWMDSVAMQRWGGTGARTKGKTQSSSWFSICSFFYSGMNKSSFATSLKQ
jgi:hypothetical protein